MNWIAQPNDRASMNGRPVLLVRQRSETGMAGEPICAVFMNKEAGPGLFDAEGHARLMAMAPRMAAFVARLFEAGVDIAPDDRTEAMQEAMAIHEALTGERDRYRTPRSPDGSDEPSGDPRAAAA